MKGQLDDVTRRLRAANPVAVEPGLDAWARADLHRVLAEPVDRVSAARPRRVLVPRMARLAVVAVALALLTVAGSVFAGAGWLPFVSRSPAYAATPPPLQVLPDADLTDYGLAGPGGRALHAAAVLTALARRVETLPDDVGSGRYARIDLDGWALWTEVDGQRVTSEVVPTSSTVWVAADGSGRVRSVASPGGDPHRTDERFGPGGRRGWWPLGSIETADDKLEAQLAVAHPVQNGPAERFVAVTDLAGEQPLPPRTRSAILRFVARTPGLREPTMVRDRLGRTGVAVSVDSAHSGLPTRYTLVFDPGTGVLLGKEDMLTETAGALNVPVPSVISYTAYRDARYVDSLE